MQADARIKAWLTDSALEPHGKAWNDATHETIHHCLGIIAHASRARACGVHGDREGAAREAGVMFDAMHALAEHTVALLAVGDTEPPQWPPSAN